MQVMKIKKVSILLLALAVIAFGPAAADAAVGSKAASTNEVIEKAISQGAVVTHYDANDNAL